MPILIVPDCLNFHIDIAADVNTYCVQGSNLNIDNAAVAILIVPGGSNFNIDNAAGGITYFARWFKLQYRQCSWWQYLLCPVVQT